jgi:hypothetical protein
MIRTFLQTYTYLFVKHRNFLKLTEHKTNSCAQTEVGSPKINYLNIIKS